MSETNLKYFCVIYDQGYRATGFPTEAEADAYFDGFSYAQRMDLSIIGVFEAESEIEAIEKAKADDAAEALDPEEDDEYL